MKPNGLHERIKAVRKSLTPKVSQTVFADMLGTSRRAITTYETGVVTPTDTFIQLLCTKFNISEEWLRTGAGDMKETPAADEFSEFAAHHNLTPAETEVMRYCFFLPQSDRAALFRHITKLADTIRAAEEAEQQNTPAAEPPTASAAIEAKVAAYREQLIAEEKGLSASSSGNRNIEKA